MAKILIKFPTRGRPNVFFSAFNLYYSFLSGKHDYEFRISMDVDDDMNHPQVWDFLDSKKNVIYCYGENCGKIEAINANMNDAEFDVLLLASDDMTPVAVGYDDIIISEMKKHYPNYDGALHFNDGRVGSTIITLSIMGKKMYDSFGYIYHPQFKSLWCDNEFTDVVYARKKATYIDRVIIKHDWVDITGKDNLHTKNENNYYRDKSIYEARKAAGFPTAFVTIPGLETEQNFFAPGNQPPIPNAPPQTPTPMPQPMSNPVQVPLPTRNRNSPFRRTLDRRVR